MEHQPSHFLKWNMPAHRQLHALTLANDGTVLSDKTAVTELTVGDIHAIIRQFKSAYEIIGELAVKVND